MAALDHLRLLVDYLRPGTLILRRPSNALGDNLLLTAVAREIRKARPATRVVVETPYPAIFLHNPYVALAVDGHFKTTRRHLKPKYFLGPEAPRVHLLDQLFAAVPFPLPEAERRVELFFSLREVAEHRRRHGSGHLAIAPTGKQSHSADRKEWGIERFQAVVDRLPGRRWVQIGAPSDPLLRGVEDRRGLPVRESAGVLAGARLFVGLEGGVMHLAAAVGTPAVILYGGYIAPECSTWPGHVVLSRAPDCSPCVRSHERATPCPHAMKCMTEIGVEEVAGTVEKLLE